MTYMTYIVMHKSLVALLQHMTRMHMHRLQVNYMAMKVSNYDLYEHTVYNTPLSKSCETDY